jgi:subtilisin family serine protease/N-acetylneuraminic acid mutarotase
VATVLLGSLAAAAPAIPPPPASPPAVASEPESWQEQVAPEVLETLSTEGEADFFVTFDARADLTGAAAITGWGERGAYVVERLRATAADSQRQVTALLDRAGADYRPYWIANAILVEDGSPELAQRMVAVPAVTELHEVTGYELPELVPGESTAAAASVEWGIDAIRADQVWADLGARGEEVVVANIDTGVAYDHPDLVDRYLGNRGEGGFDHDYHWFDPSSICDSGSDPAPCDNHGHGTHTMGTMVGGEAGGTAIGVAPGARWIAAKGCEATGQVGCSTPAVLAAGQWTLAPTDRNGENPRPSRRPHIVNNSWGANTGPVADPFYDQIVDAWLAAGMFAVFSNGNDGNRGCFTAGSPADSANAYAVGAHDIENQLAPFSSRGPGAGGTVRPHLTAPGVAVRSSIPNGYTAANGTSMAAPHVAATAALMWSAAPSLVGDVTGTRELLNQTAVDTEDLTCGGTPENNNMFGEGRLDAYAAVDAAPAGPAGTLSGVVTDAGTGAPVPRARVHATSPDYQRSTTAEKPGRYEMSLVTGSYEVSVAAYGYEEHLASGVEITQDATTTGDFGLTALPSVTLSGTVADGSGQGWPLYAGLTIAGYPHGTVYTDPVTGRYEVVLPASTTYQLTTQSRYDGYEQLTRSVTVGETDTEVDIALTATTEQCAAAGYRPAHSGLYHPFDAGTAPEGWTLESGIGDGWEFDDPAGRDNLTGGAGGFASIDSAHGARLEDGWLTTPPVDLTGSGRVGSGGGAGSPVLSFRTDLLNSRGTAEIELSVDDGASWRRIWLRTASLRGPRLVQLSLAEAAGQAGVRVRFHYRNDIPSNGFWQLDEVLVGHRTCEPVPGGLVVGEVSDGRSGDPLNDATVYSAGQPELRTTTVDTPDDGAVGGGFYWLFSPHTGGQGFRAEHALGQYAPATVTPIVTAGRVVRADFALASGEIQVSAGAVDVAAEYGAQRTATVTLTNVGTAPASYQLAERDDRFALTDAQRATLRGSPAAASWAQLHDTPTTWTDTLGARHGDELHVVGGSSGVSQRNLIYDITEDRWRFTGTFMPVRSKPAGGFVDDLLYVVGGWGRAGEGAVATTLVYDPAADRWSAGADVPYRVAAAGYAVLEDKLYLIGGRSGEDSDTAVATVSVYDPATDTWTRLADYPEPASWQSCGAIDGLVYCAGGRGERHQPLSRAYAYHPGADRWYRIADLPLTVTSSGAAAANGLLLLSGGNVGGYRTSQGFYYDPATGDWSELPDALFPVERMASACGFYKVGGYLNPAVGNVPWVEQLPGFDQCDETGGDRVPWLAADAPGGTLAPGESVEVTLTFSATAAAGVDQPGDHRGWLSLLEDTPFQNHPIEVGLDVTPPASWARITGTVTGLARCDGPAEPVAGALVRIHDVRLDRQVRTDEYGRYGYWLDSYRDGRRPLPPLDVTASAGGWTSDTTRVVVRPGVTVTADLTLRRDEPCATADPAEVTLTMGPGQRRTVPVTLANRDGAAPYDFQVATSTHALDPLLLMDTGWTDAAPLPGRPGLPGGLRNYAHAQCPEEPDTGYVIGGIDAAVEPARKAWRYDSAADRWQPLAPPPRAPGSDPVAVCEAGQVHLLGGDGSDRHYVYDIARDSWREAAPLPSPRSEAAAGVWSGRIHLAGGTGDGGAFETLDRVDVYDIATDTWRDGPPLPVATRSPGFVQVGPYLYVAGGQDRNAAEQLLDTVARLDLATGGWSLGPALASPRAGVALAATDQALYAVGGYGAGQFGTVPTTTVQRLPLAGWDSGPWVTGALADLPVPRADSRAGFCTQGRAGGEIWSVGGASGLERAMFHALPGERCPSLVSGVDWLSLSATTGTVHPGGGERLLVTVDTAGLTAGETYRATILVTTTDPGAPQLRIPVRLMVG